MKPMPLGIPPIRAFDLMPNGTLAKQTDRVFVDLRGSEPGVPDGMKVDVEGKVYCGGAGGLWIMDPHGKKLGRIVHGAPATTNLAFGGHDWKTLYFTSGTVKPYPVCHFIHGCADAAIELHQRIDCADIVFADIVQKHVH